eukprot:6688177-Alexandrium_andersonii.AAC.1
MAACRPSVPGARSQTDVDECVLMEQWTPALPLCWQLGLRETALLSPLPGIIARLCSKHSRGMLAAAGRRPP